MTAARKKQVMQEIGRTARSVAPTAKRILTQSWGQNLSLRLLVLLQGVIFQNSPAWNIHPLIKIAAKRAVY